MLPEGNLTSQLPEFFQSEVSLVRAQKIYRKPDTSIYTPSHRNNSNTKERKIGFVHFRSTACQRSGGQSPDARPPEPKQVRTRRWELGLCGGGVTQKVDRLLCWGAGCFKCREEMTEGGKRGRSTKHRRANDRHATGKEGEGSPCKEGRGGKTMGERACGSGLKHEGIRRTRKKGTRPARPPFS